MEKEIDLMAPRFRVIAHYPGNLIKVGEVITMEEFDLLVKEDEDDEPEQFPAIFQPISWWKDRTPEEMPEYVRNTSPDTRFNGTVGKVEKWHTGEPNSMPAPLVKGYYWFSYEPATLAEYEAYQSK